ncbi:coiled-coil domain-containing protein R3HCC1L-like [Teleopsis dalmanni]|uniref:coiled-coil domain-containing protein R3HCC1L-like n=1 Tax=Teleopsis dalmanni TaxID=139649 RepID=UPI0018CEC7DD|nr:coiled-coil domain-containing protein R3HCC1L-like [Teleopsis dalmanni]
MNSIINKILVFLLISLILVINTLAVYLPENKNLNIFQLNDDIQALKQQQQGLNNNTNAIGQYQKSYDKISDVTKRAASVQQQQQQYQTQPQSPAEGNTHLQIINNFPKQNIKNLNSYDYLHNSENICSQLNDTNEMKSSKKHNKNQRTLKVETVGKPANLLIEDVVTNDTSRTLPKCDIDEQELQRASKEINRSNRRIIKQSFVSDVLEIPERIEQNGTDIEKPNAKTSKSVDVSSNTEEEEDDWETMFDESGECLDPKILEELTASVGKVKIELPKMDYNTYLTKQTILNEEEFPHVLEVSNFPVEFKNQDLLMLFSQYKESGFDIKWVDDTHALAVFSSSRIAAEVLSMRHPFVVLKPLAEATAESRLKAKKCATSLQPYRPRPETCAALARRLVTGALGVRLKTAAAERENEKRVLREAKERKLLAAKQRDEAWDN